MPQQHGHDRLVVQTTATDPKMLRLYEYITDTLIMDSARRSRLPVELIRHVFFIGGFIRHKPEMDERMETSIDVHASNGIMITKCWMVSGPLNSTFAARPGGVRLTTVSHYQGWDSDPSEGPWSWFELAVVPPGAEDENGCITYDRVKLRPDGSPLTWISHKHPVDSGKSTGRDSEEYEGMMFDASHELWSSVTAGDRLAVFACAQFPAWGCMGEKAKLEFFAPYDPTRATTITV